MEPYSSNSALESKRRDFSPPPMRQLTFEEAVGKGTTFLDESSFYYKDEVIKYFDGKANPIDDAAEFLDTLQAVLEATTPLESKSARVEEVDPVKQNVRSKFIDLYHSNQWELQEQEHAVHAMVPRTAPFEEEDFGSYVPYGASSYRPDPMVTEIERYLGLHGSVLIEKYLAEEDAVDPCNHADEFYALYTAILRSCPKAPTPVSLSVSTSLVEVQNPRTTLRSQFDRIYEANQQGLRKCWAEEHSEWAREIEQLQTTPFMPSFRSPPKMQYRRDGGYPPPPQTHGGYGSYSFSTLPAFSMGTFTLAPPVESFESLQSRLGAFNFVEHGLDGMSERVAAFYDAAPTLDLRQGRPGYSSGSSHQAPTTCFPLGERDLFTVLKAVLTQLKPAERSLLAEETVDSVVRSRFIEIFHYAATADESQRGLTEQQVLEINALVGHSERASFRPLRHPQSRFGSSSLSSGGKKRPPGGGGGGSSIVKVGLLLLALYLGYRLAKPAYQWIRGNQTTPVGE